MVSVRSTFWTSLISIAIVYPSLQSVAIATNIPRVDSNLSNNYLAQNKGERPDKYLKSAVRKYQEGKYTDAIIDLDRAIELKPDYAIAYDLRALIKYQKLKDFPGALTDFNRALGINPSLATSYYNRALLKYRNLQDRAGGIADMQEAAKLFKAKGNSESAQDAMNFLKRWETAGS